jgi:RNA polymerase sigma factor (sigma-70 family)
MAFPDTRHSLIRRLVDRGEHEDWRQFLTDYWGPLCRFCAARGNLSFADAEDIAAQTFTAILSGQLLHRWSANPAAKWRTLVCNVARNILANRARVEAGRARLVGTQLPAVSDETFADLDEPQDNVDSFYRSWALDLLEQVIEALLTELHRTGKGDYFRVLHGRICEQMTLPEVAKSLDISVSTAENYFKAARKRLAAILEITVREYVARYTPPSDAVAEFTAEWAQLGQFLAQNGGLESAVRAAYDGQSNFNASQRKSASIELVLSKTRPPTVSKAKN